MKNNWSVSGAKQNVSPDMVPDEFLEAEVVLLMQGTNLFGDAVYAYLKVTGKNLKAMFTKMKAGENFKPADFGSILAAGRGVPSEELKNEMRAEYNMLDVPQSKVGGFANAAQPKFFGDD